MWTSWVRISTNNRKGRLPVHAWRQRVGRCLQYHLWSALHRRLKTKLTSTLMIKIKSQLTKFIIFLNSFKFRPKSTSKFKISFKIDFKLHFFELGGDTHCVVDPDDDHAVMWNATWSCKPASCRKKIKIWHENNQNRPQNQFLWPNFVQNRLIFIFF